MASPSASAEDKPSVAIVDYGSGNLFSIDRACRQAGVTPFLATSARDLQSAAGVVLPGVGAFGQAMEALRRLDLVEPLRDLAARDVPLLAICLGMQLLLDESFEFGRHEGLGLVSGEVRPLTPPAGDPRLRVPHVGWAPIDPAGRDWTGSALAGLAPGEQVYFVHSLRVCPADASLTLSTTPFGDERFCSSLARGSLFACQFHPERSGNTGLKIVANFLASLPSPDEDPHARA